MTQADALSRAKLQACKASGTTTVVVVRLGDGFYVRECDHVRDVWPEGLTVPGYEDDREELPTVVWGGRASLVILGGERL